MLLLPDLITFTEAFAQERPNLETETIVTAEHDEAHKLYKDVANSGNACTLFALIPSHDGAGQDEDNAKLKNNLTFIVMKKTDTTAGYKKKLDNMALCQLEVLALAKKIKTLIENFGANCMFKNIDLNTLQIDPLSNYLNANGYSLSFATETSY